MKISRILCFCLPLALAAGHVQAQDDLLRNTFYIGAGRAESGDPLENDDTPWSIGFLHQRADSRLVLGFDIGREGTMIDSTWGLDERPKQATSYNLLIGGSLVDNGRFRTDAALLVGLRESFADCPDSYLGFQCYADRAPDTEYKGNFGAVLTLSVDRLALGLRATGESTQLVAGLRF
ncbi:hypothetical protein SAMN04488021_10430 [Paracoccus aminovorans]|uniref:Outer membrane protein beta-barrel domain-containing protein n=1 Tax=Paracoccus aminovorans TaxID=34004 RepID=A0A1I2YF53_9RHOB|nr:hypothetical protein [Paracoccus aminovorans]CQR86645.1 hypothetical protein JCM7685_2086 [Paracoccus aminovorans]SFH24215.1 hypothetical protein SAMN04488021_10430 [Paracoccus aminovorans]